MAVPAAVAVAAKKVAVSLLLNKKTWVLIASVLAGIAVVCLLPVMVLLSISNELSGVDFDPAAIQQQLESNMTEEQREQIQYYETVMTAIRDEITAQGLEINPVKAEVIYMYALVDKEQESDTFYTDYIFCFAHAEDDDHLFENITQTFGVSFTAEEKERILSLCARAVESQESSAE